MKKLIFVCVVSLFFGGCASMSNDGKVGDFVRSDIEMALQMAQQSGDVIAVGCYQSLLDNYQFVDFEPTEVKGVVSGFQKSRELRININAGVPSEVHIKCSPLVVDAQKTLIGLGIRIR